MFQASFHVGSANRAFTGSFSSVSGQRHSSARRCSGVCLTTSICKVLTTTVLFAVGMVWHFDFDNS